MAEQKQITYLLGAGASASKIPCLDTFTIQLEAAIIHLKRTTKTWLSENWMWVAGTALVLLIFAVGSRGSRSRTKKTTVIKDDYGNVKSITSTEIVE